MDCDCKKIHEELVFLYADNEMGQETLVAFQRHLERCPECAQDARYTRKLLMVVRQRVPRECAPTRLKKRLLDALSQRRGMLS